MTATWYRQGTYLAVQHGPDGQKLFRDLALDFVGLTGIEDTTITAYPTDVSHGRIDALDMELVLQADRKTVEWTRSPPMFRLVIVEFLCTGQSLVEEYLEKTGILCVKLAIASTQICYRASHVNLVVSIQSGER